MSMEKAEGIFQEISVKEKLTKTDIKRVKDGYNRHFEAQWDQFVKRACLNAEERDRHTGLTHQIYWMNTPTISNMNAAIKKLRVLEKQYSDSPYFPVLETAIETLETYKPYIDKVAHLQERLDGQPVVDKNADPMEVLLSSIPIATRATMKMIKDLLVEKSAPIKAQIETDTFNYMHATLNNYLERSAEDRSKHLSKVAGYQAQFLSMVTTFKNGKVPRVRSEEADEKIIKLAKENAEMIAGHYVYKHVEKLTAILDRMPALTNIEINIQPNQARLEGWMNLKFEDNRSFLVNSQVVMVWNDRKTFSRYPTTFHNVMNADGTMEGKMLSEREMIDWAEGTKGIDLAPTM